MLTRWMLAACLTGGVAAAPGFAQSGDRPLQKFFGGSASKSGTAKAGEDGRRKTEIDVELAWLADPITFPYFLEAHVDGTTLNVRGYVPNQAVRDYALKLARLRTPLTVTDALKEHPSLLVQTAKETPAQLQSAVAAALREALPRQSKSLQIECTAEGTVMLRGALTSAEDKLLASHALRRLYGCTSVQNLIQLPSAPSPAQAKQAPLPAEPSKSPLPPIASIGSPIPSKEPAKESTPPLKQEPMAGPQLAPPPAVVPKETPKTAGTVALSPEQKNRLQKRILEECPGAKGVTIEVTAQKKIQIELTVLNNEQIEMFAGKIYNLSEITELRDLVELHFTVGQ